MRLGNTRRATALWAFLAQLEAQFTGRVLPVDRRDRPGARPHRRHPQRQRLCRYRRRHSEPVGSIMTCVQKGLQGLNLGP